MRKRKQKGRTVINFSLVLVVFKRHHGSEGVKKKNVFVVVGFCFSIFVVGLFFLFLFFKLRIHTIFNPPPAHEIYAPKKTTTKTCHITSDDLTLMTDSVCCHAQ